jgi:hypothetical protein
VSKVPLSIKIFHGFFSGVGTLALSCLLAKYLSDVVAVFLTLTLVFWLVSWYYSCKYWNSVSAARIANENLAAQASQSNSSGGLAVIQKVPEVDIAESSVDLDFPPDVVLHFEKYSGYTVGSLQEDARKRKLVAWKIALEDREDADQHDGARLPEDQRISWIQMKAAELEVLALEVELAAQMDVQRLARTRQTERREERRHQEVVEAIENSTSYGRVNRFRRNNPFLGGLLGDEKIEQINKFLK